MSQTLVLNATYEPLGVVSDRRALILVLNQRATMVEESETVLHYSGGEITLPSVVKLTKFVRIPYRHAVPLSRRALFARDGGRCVYCQVYLDKKYHVDHIIAIANGGHNDKNNLQILCAPCNQSKSSKDPIEFMQSQGRLI